MSATYIQLDKPITQIHCLDEAIKAAGGTWNRPKIFAEIERARSNLAIAKNTINSIQANQELAQVLEELGSVEIPQIINININGKIITLVKRHGRYLLRGRNPVDAQNLQIEMKKIEGNYQSNVNKLEREIQETMNRLEEQKDILSSEQLEMERLRLQNEKLALDNANKQRVVEVTKELEEKLAARGFEIRKRMIGKKIVYQAVRR